MGFQNSSIFQFIFVSVKYDICHRDGYCNSNYNSKKNFLLKLLDRESKYPGKVLKSGYVTGWGKNFFTTSPDWLNGGTTSWNLKYAKDLFSRKYPLLKWLMLLLLI